MITVPVLTTHDDDTYRVVQMQFEPTAKWTEKSQRFASPHEYCRLVLPENTFLCGASIEVAVDNLLDDNDPLKRFYPESNALVLNCFNAFNVRLHEDHALEILSHRINTLLLTQDASNRLTHYAAVYPVLRQAGFPKLVADTILFFCALDDASLCAALFTNSLQMGGIASRFESFYRSLRNRITVPLYLNCSEARPLLCPMGKSVSADYMSMAQHTQLNLHAMQTRDHTAFDSAQYEEECYRWNRWQWASLHVAFRREILHRQGRPHKFILLCITSHRSAAEPLQPFFREAVIAWGLGEPPQRYESQQSFLRRIGDSYWFLFRANVSEQDTHASVLFERTDELVAKEFVSRSSVNGKGGVEVCLTPVENSDLNLREWHFAYWTKWSFLRAQRV